MIVKANLLKSRGKKDPGKKNSGDKLRQPNNRINIQKTLIHRLIQSARTKD